MSEKLRETLDRASEEVESWPWWKQGCLTPKGPENGLSEHKPILVEMINEYTTRNGKEVRIYETDGGISGAVIHGAVLTKTMGWKPFSWLSTGKAYEDQNHEWDLKEVKRV